MLSCKSMGCIKLDILDRSYSPLKVVYRKGDLSEKGVQRFMRTDPMMDMYPGWSPYNYTLNNPVKYTDPTGMHVETDYYDTKGNLLKHTDDGSDDIVIVGDNDMNIFNHLFSDENSGSFDYNSSNYNNFVKSEVGLTYSPGDLDGVWDDMMNNLETFEGFRLLSPSGSTTNTMASEYGAFFDIEGRSVMGNDYRVSFGSPVTGGSLPRSGTVVVHTHPDLGGASLQSGQGSRWSSVQTPHTEPSGRDLYQARRNPTSHFNVVIDKNNFHFYRGTGNNGTETFSISR